MLLIEKLKNIGVSTEMPEADKLMVQTVNRLTAYYYFFSVISTIINAQFLTFTKLIPVILIFHLYLLSFLFTFLKLFETARYNIWVVTMLVIFWMSSAFGYESNSHLLFYVMILTTVTSFEFKSMKLLGFVVSIPIILLIILYLTHFSLFHIEGIPDNIIKIIGTNFVFITAFSIAISALQYKNEFERRTSMITKSEEQLKLKITELEKTNEELDSFVYRVTHDLRAPIASTLGLLSLSKSDKNNIEYYQELQEKSLHKLDFFINDVLQYAKNKRMEVLISEVQLPSLITEVGHALENEGVYPKIKIEVDCHHQLPLLTDSFRLKLILSNLISNSMRYYDTAKPSPYVKISSFTENGTLILKVEDNGVGIDPKHQPKIFEMFFRASKLSQGTGLGLYIVKEAVKVLNGTVELESTLNEGTTFWIKIPIQS